MIAAKNYLQSLTLDEKNVSFCQKQRSSQTNKSFFDVDDFKEIAYNSKKWKIGSFCVPLRERGKKLHLTKTRQLSFQFAH